MTERRNTSPFQALAPLTVGLAGPAAFLVAWLASRHVSALPSFCPFLNLTSLPCPSCGLTRALAALLHGDLPAAMQWHAFAPLFPVLALAAWIWALGRLATPHSFPALPRWRLRRRVWVTSLAIFFAYYLLRIAGCCPVPDGYFPPPSAGMTSRPGPCFRIGAIGQRHARALPLPPSYCRKCRRRPVAFR